MIPKMNIRDVKNFNINFGPQHPAAHGVLRLVVELDGEIIRKADPHIGLLHRGTEKLIETKNYIQGLPYMDRLDYVSSINIEHSYALAYEYISSIEVPQRAKWIRIIVAELARVLNHYLSLTTHALDVGALTPFLIGFEERDRMMNILERISGARMHTAYIRPGGITSDLPETILADIYAFTKTAFKRINQLEELLSDNRIWKDRLKNIGVLTINNAYNFGFTGTMLRASGSCWDLRKQLPYDAYSNIDFKIALGINGDSIDRFLVRVEELRQSVLIIQDALNNIVTGPIKNTDLRIIAPQRTIMKYQMEELIKHFKNYSENYNMISGHSYAAIEAPKGETGVYLFN